MDPSEYIYDLDRLTNDPSDSVCMTKTSFKTLLRNITRLTAGLDHIHKELGHLRHRLDTNLSFAKEMEDIISSLTPKKKPKFGTKKNLIPDIRFTSSAERYEEALKSAPMTTLTPVPDFNEVMRKLASKL
jgi:hypothetical protein